MAWTTPKSWTTGYKVLASDMNTFLSDNDSALRAGGIAIASQAANDVLFASSSTQLARSSGLSFNDSTDALTVGGYLVTNSVGVAASDWVRFKLDGAFTSGGASTAMIGTYMNGALTGHSADSDALVGTKLNNSIVTAGNSTTIAQLWVSEPQITVGAGAVTTSASLYIEAAASEASSNYALLIASGASKLASLEATQVDILGEGDLRLQDNSGGQYVGLDAPATVSGSYTLTLPAAIGSVDQALTINNVDGTLQWATISADVAGSDTQVQFNNSGSLGASSNLTWDGSTLAVTGSITATAGVTGVIKSIQRGTISISGTAASGTATITAVTMAKAVVLFKGSKAAISGQGHYIEPWMIELTNTTTVTVERTTSAYSGNSEIPYEVLEFN